MIGLFSTFMNVFLLVQPLYLLQVFDRVITTRSHETLGMLTILASSLIVSLILLDIGRKRLLVSASLKLDALMSSKLVKSVLDETPGQPSTKANLNDLGALKQLMVSQGVSALFDTPWVLLFLGVIFYLHPKLGFLALIGVIGVVALSLTGMKVSQRFSLQAKEKGQKADSGLSQALARRELTHGLGMSQAVLERWRGYAQSAQIMQASAETSSGITNATVKGLRQLLQVAMVGVAAQLVITQEATPGILVAATILFGKMLAPVELFIANIPAYKNTYRSLKRLQAAQCSTQGSQVYRDPDAAGSVSINDLVVRAPDSNQILLKGISLCIQPGESIAVIGASGAGKTTLVKTLIGSVIPLSGSALIDHSPIASWAAEERCDVIGYLPQQSLLFAGSVADNIAGLQEPDIPQVVRAAQMAGVNKMIRGLKDGYNTQLGVNGHPLSAGEQQRIALARAVYGSPQIVVLDEPNSSIDSEGERALFHCLELLRQADITVIVITHRPAVLSAVDRVIALNKGVIVSDRSSQQMMRSLQKQAAATARPVVQEVGNAISG